jgi:hypothetical protein
MEATATLLPRTDQRLERQSDRRFFSGLAILLALAVLLGFAQTYFLRPLFRPTALTPLVHIHGFVYTLWMVLLIVQTRLVAAGRTDIHRRLGMSAFALAVLMEVFGILIPIAFAQAGNHLKGLTPSATMAIQLTNMVTFPLLIGAALYLRRQPAAHKRLMMLATLAVMSPAFVRIVRQCCTFIPISFIMVGYLLVDALVLVMFLYDWRTQRSIQRATLWGGLLLLAAHPFRFWLATTTGWERFAKWLMQLGQ